MQALSVRALWLVLAILGLSAGACAPAKEASSRLDCSQVNKTFLAQPTSDQVSAFRDLDLETQYTVFICGNQKREPPAIYLADTFAQGGVAAADFLREKLERANDDLTISDIILVLQRMSQRDTYDVASDAVLLGVVAAAVKRVKDPFWRKRSEDAFKTIQQHSSKPSR